MAGRQLRRGAQRQLPESRAQFHLTTIHKTAIGIAAVVFLAVLVARARGQTPFREISDGAIIEIYTLDALDGRLLTGAYSRFGWHHPGPLYFYLLAPFYALSGSHTAGAQAGALAINIGAAAVGAGAVATAMPAVALPVTAAIAWLAVRSGDMLVSVWNPHVIVLPLAAFVITAAAFGATGRGSYAIWTAALGSFLIQTHIATTPVVVFAGLAAAVTQWRILRGRLAAALVTLLLVLWFPPLIEQVTRSPGNLTKLASFFIKPAPTQTAAAAAAAWSSMLLAPFAAAFTVAKGYDFSPVLSWPLGAALVEIGLLTAGGAALRRRNPPVAWLAAICAGATVVAFVAATRIREQIVDHELFWVSALGALNVGLLVGVALELLGRRTKAVESSTWTRASVVRSVCAAAVMLLVATGVLALNRTIHRARGIDDHAVDVILDQFEAAVRAGRIERPLVHIQHSIWSIAAGALLEYRKHHGAAAVDRDWTTMFGVSFVPDGSEDAEFTFSGTNLHARVIRNR